MTTRSSWKESEQYTELKSKLQVRPPTAFATASTLPSRSLIADTACAPVSITAEARLVAHRKPAQGTFNTAAGPGKIVAVGTLKLPHPALARLPVAQVAAAPPGAPVVPSLLSVGSFLNSDPTASGTLPPAPPGQHEFHLENGEGRVATFRENDRGLFELVEGPVAPASDEPDEEFSLHVLAHMFDVEPERFFWR